MAIKWLDAKRLQGTNAERLAVGADNLNQIQQTLMDQYDYVGSGGVLA